MPYTWLTFAQLKAQLLNRLEDVAGKFWTNAEAGLYIIEALRVWQAYTRFWRDRMTFNTSNGDAFYDLGSIVGSLIPFTVTEQQVISMMMYHLLEPQFVANAYTGSEMFDQDAIVGAVQSKRDQFLMESGLVAYRAVVPGPAPGNGRKVLTDDTIQIIRAAWKDADGRFSTLWKSDERGAQSFQPGWSNAPGFPPQAYNVMAATPPMGLQLIPPNVDVGEIDLCRVLAGAAIDPAAGVPLGIPDDFAWVVKWGAIGELLNRQGESIDAERSAYCQARWVEGVAIARQFTSVVTAYINGVQVRPVSISELDMYRPGWQNETHALPEVLALASWNLVGLAPVPDAGPYSVMMDVVRNAPVPTLDASQIQIGREEVDAILDYAEHLASFKQGGEEFLASGALYSNMVQLAQTRNQRLKAGIPFYEPLTDQTKRQEDIMPTRDINS